MTQVRLFLLITFSAAIFAKISPNYSESYNLIKVRIAKNLKVIEVSGTDLHRNLHPLKSEKTFAGRKKIRFKCESISKLKDMKHPVLLATVKSSTGLITFNKNKYRGRLKVVTSKNKKSCDVINELDMNSYISSLLSKEMNAAWPIEALKAQAITARTYAIDKIKKARSRSNYFYDLENSEKHQVNGDFFDATKKTLKAAKETAGMVLKDNRGNLIPTFFHASCGGHTLRPDDVWTNEINGYKSANCSYCKTKKNWNTLITRKRFHAFLEWAEDRGYLKKIRDKREVVIYPDKRTNKFLSMSIGKHRVKIRKTHLRRYFGRVLFPSNNVLITSGLVSGNLRFIGRGNGHGVGMCQIGSKGYAHKGWSYQRILAHYFPKFSIRRF